MPILRPAIILILLLFPGYVFAESADITQIPLSEKAEISLITGAPGNPLYTKWGHSAIRVYDPENRIDLVYNYGTFDFDTEGFYMKFLRGKLKYSLSRYEFRRMVAEYQYFDQKLIEQVLNLNYDEKIEIFDFLNTNFLPENRYYLYDFFFDNCSSRIRDVFKDLLGENLIFNDDHIKKRKTFRQLLDDFIETQTPWGDFGIDLIIGLPADRLAPSWDYMFLPYEMYDAFENAVIIRDGEKTPFVKNVNIIHQAEEIKAGGSWFIPIYIFSVIFILIMIITFFEYRAKTHFKPLDIFIFGITGLAGVIIGFLWFATDHITTKDNLNFLWASPLHLITIYLLLKKRHKRFKSYFFLFWAIFYTLLLIGWNYVPQQFHIAIIPILLILITRSFFIYKTQKN